MEHETSPPSNTPAVQSAQMAAMRRAEQDGGSNSFLEPSMMNGVNSDNFSAHYLAHPSSIDTAYAELSGQGHIAQNQQHSRSLHPTLSFGATHVDTHGTPNPAAAPFSNGSTSIHADNVPPFRFNEEDFGSVAVDPNLLNFPNNGLHVLSDSTHGHHYDNNVVPLASNSIQSDGQQTLPTLSRHQSSSPHSNSVSGFAASNIQIDSFPRNREASTSLDPSSALFGNNDWAQLNSYRGHHRTASDNISEYSAHSNQASPYIGNLDVFETSQVSPLLGAAQDPSFNTDLGLQQFTLNDTHHSPAHSPGHSPHISPQQQSLPLFAAENMFGVTNPNLDTHFSQHKQNHDMFPAINSEAFPTFGQHSPGEFGAADQMSPPEINIDYAPPSGVPAEHDRMPKIADDTLSPPHGYLGRGRERAKSDSFAGSRSSTPGFSGRGRLPSLQSEERRDKLSPFHNQSRSPSPGRGRAGSLGNRARSSSAASDHRDYILDLAIPERSPSNGGDSKRVQKHPATFQCTLCPKRFTRAYNLRSHLRTHTDERPFVCTVCGKAFARQHDRKRHEGLHSGEKKFVCRGLLQNNSSWGCGRRFARADALGRHFRSEAGRVCIKPLLDEEIAEKRKQMAEDQLQTHFTPGITVQQSMMDSSPIDVMSTFLPAAILQQYPALANIDWSAMQSVPHPDDNYGGRTSFDASSGGDYDLSENEASDYADTNSMNVNMIEGMGLNINGQDTHQQIQHNALRGPADYLGDFDGR